MELPRIVRAVIFDMDGLLVDSEAVYLEALTFTARNCGLDLPQSVMRRMIGHSWPGAAAEMKAWLGEGYDTDTFRRRLIEEFWDLHEAEIALKAGVLEVLAHLDAVGLPRAIATSSDHKAVTKNLAPHALRERFHAVVAQGDYARTKPAPDPYLRAAELLGVDPADCLALEDSHNGVRAAAAAGMMTIMVPDMLEPTAEMHSLCVRIAHDLHEVCELLKAQAAR